MRYCAGGAFSKPWIQRQPSQLIEVGERRGLLQLLMVIGIRAGAITFTSKSIGITS